MTDVTQNILTRYAVVRAPRATPIENLATNVVEKPRAKSEFWQRLTEIVDDKQSTSDAVVTAAKQFLSLGSPFDGESEFSRALNDVTGRLTSLPSYNDPYALVKALKEQTAPIQGDEKQELLAIWLWDHLAARLIATPTDRENVKFTQALTYLQIWKKVSEARGEEESLTSPSLNPEVLIPADLSRFIRRAKLDRRSVEEKRAKAIAERERAAELLSSKYAILSGALSSRLSGALLGGEVAAATPPDHDPTPPPSVAPGPDEPGDAASMSGTQALTLSAQAIAEMPQELKQFASDALGVADLSAHDIIELTTRAKSKAEAARTRLVSKLAPRTRVHVLGELNDAIQRVLSGESSAEIEATSVSKAVSAKTSTLPDFTNPNPIRLSGLCDLKVVRQQLQKYTLGEIAYIENVMEGEERSRTHHRLDRTEQQLVFEVEESTSSERDLQTTDRFELNHELENVEKENKTTDMGVNVTGSYGAVTIAAHANATSTNSSENAQKVARSTVKENVTKAIDKVQKSVRRQQTITVTTETTEDNVHRFVGQKSSIVGLYRYVEKNYWCQVYNYGARLMLEFMVPEPAASYLFYQSKSPKSDVHLIAPEPPNFTASEITEHTYQDFSARYNAQVNDPPPEWSIGVAMLSHSKEKEEGTKVTVPDGYEAVYAFLGWAWQFVDRTASLQVVMAGNAWRIFVPPPPKPGLPKPPPPIEGSAVLGVPLRGELAIHVQPHRTALPWTVGVSLVLRRTSGAFQKWQLETYRAIIDAYQVTKDEYDRKLAASQSKSRTVSLRSDLEYRNTERTELKRGALELLTNQHFTSMGAIATGPDDEPILDAPKALEEGPTVQFFEQAFEWTNMTYTFYPYFWGRTETWEDRQSVADADPVFSRFLSAGYARVSVPVRRYFEKNIRYYLDYGDIWEGDDCPLPGDADYISIIEEIKEIEAGGSPDLMEGIPDGDPWRITIPTPLVFLDDPNVKVKLPSWEIVVPNTTPYEPSADTCNGVPYNLAQWPDADHKVAELVALGYKGPLLNVSPATFLTSAPGQRVVKAFQRRVNGLRIADALGSPLKVDGILGPCTLRGLTVAAEWRRLKQWPGPA